MRVDGPIDAGESASRVRRRRCKPTLAVAQAPPGIDEASMTALIPVDTDELLPWREHAQQVRFLATGHRRGRRFATSR